MKTDKTEEFILCACSSFDHQAIFWVWPEESAAGDEIYVNFHLAKRNGFFKRLWYGLKYAFGFNSRYGAWDEFIFSKREFAKLRDFVNHNNL